MLRITYSRERTNSFRPVPWALTSEPFPAWRGEGARHRAFLPVARDYAPRFFVPLCVGYRTHWQHPVSMEAAKAAEGRMYLGKAENAAATADVSPSKVVRTAKGGLLLVPCPPAEDERIMLVTLRGGFRGEFGRVEVVDGDILDRRESNVHCCPVKHLVVRLRSARGYVVAETGRRSWQGSVDLHTWNRGIIEMTSEEFDVLRELNKGELPPAPVVDDTQPAEAAWHECGVCQRKVVSLYHYDGTRVACVPCVAAAMKAVSLEVAS